MKKSYSIFMLAATLILASACERDEEVQGPLLLDLYGEFELIEGLSSSRSSVDFTTETVVFNAKFNKLTQWELTITGAESGAIKIITDLSREINALNAEWEGTTTIFPVFKEEVCYVDLFIPEDTLHLYDTITIAQVRTVDGLVIEDFDNGFNSNWTNAPQAGGFIQLNEDTNVIQGTGNYYIGGLISFNEYLVALGGFPASAYGLNTFDLPSDPANLYFNFLLYVPQENNGGFILFDFYEDDNGDGVYENSDALKEDFYRWELQNEELSKGWNVYSIQYARLLSLSGGESIGNSILEPNKITNIEFLYLHPPMLNESEIYMDYVAFTTDGPLKL